MATTIITKYGSGAPAASDVVRGELAVDTENKRLYTEDSGGSVVELGTNPAANVTFGDNVKAVFGAGSDLQIYHDGSNSRIREGGTGNLLLDADSLYLRSTSGDSYFQGLNGGAANVFYNGSVKLATTSTGIDVTGTVTADGLTVDTDTLVVDATNNRVGIGTASPASELHVKGSTPDLRVENTTASETVSLSLIKTATKGFSINNKAISGTNYLTFNLDTAGAGTDAMVIDGASGNVGIGTDSPTVPLHILKAASGVNQATDVLRLSSVDTDTSYYVGFQTQRDNSAGMGLNILTTDVSGNVSESMRIDTSGNLLVGRTGTAFGSETGVHLSPDGYIHQERNFTGTGNFGVLNQRDGTGTSRILFQNGQVDRGSIVWTTSATAYNTSSDQRLKENIVDAPSASDDIDAIQVRSFDWKADGSHQKYGMIAQELQTVAPEAVSVPEDPEEMMGVDYSKLVPMLVKEVQQLRARVAQLEGAN